MATRAPALARTYSLRGRLLWLLLIAVAVVALVQGAVGYYAASSEADEIFDHQMEQAAMALRGGLPLGASPQRPARSVAEASLDFAIQVSARHGTPGFAS